MLVLSRKIGERIRIGEDVQIVVLKSKGGRIKLGFDAPAEVPIYRDEMLTEDPSSNNCDTLQGQLRLASENLPLDSVGCAFA